METNHRNTRKVALTILALGAATAAVVFGSLAVWTAQTTNPGNTVTAGTLTMTNDKDANFVFDVDPIKPGETGFESVTIGNTGDTDLDVVLTKDGEAETPDAIDGDITADLDYYIEDDATGTCLVPAAAVGVDCATQGWEDWSTTQTNLAVGTLTSGGGTKTFNIGWRYDEIAGDQNAQMGDSASFDLTWDGTPS